MELFDMSIKSFLKEKMYLSKKVLNESMYADEDSQVLLSQFFSDFIIAQQ